MHTITICPRCNKDFMYHWSDVHLYREVAWDLSIPQACSYEVICQNCDEEEKQSLIDKQNDKENI